ncbi:hypothetical protein RU639_013147 [Aspergillus parasiticus]|uniref:Uncharacterized protein n=1 Tax=Aspergillus transmontanensis TaxID=1034304 RepID=A0A5N6VND1_9EURO|nr:hypothetical protein BDV41DRAFT_581356 [Aspergillus transmontanensis]
MDSSQPALPEPSLLEIFRFQCPNVYFKSSPSDMPIGGISVIESANDLIDSRAPGFLRISLPSWENYGLFSNSPLPYGSEGKPRNEYDTLYPLAHLRMAQEVYLRLFQIVQYLHVIRRMHLLKLERVRGQRISQKRGQRVDGLAINLTLAEMYSDWETVEEELRSVRKLQFRKENRLARRWLLVATRLSFGALLICSKKLEREINNNHTKESQLIARATNIANDFPDIVETYQHLNLTAMCLLNQRPISHTTNIDLIVNRVDAHLKTAGSAETTPVEFPFSTYPEEESNSESPLSNAASNP